MQHPTHPREQRKETPKGRRRLPPVLDLACQRCGHRWRGCPYSLVGGKPVGCPVCGSADVDHLEEA